MEYLKLAPLHFSQPAALKPFDCLTEIKARYLREGRDPSKRISFILDRSFVIDIDEEIALMAADYRQKHGLHTVDALIYASAKSKKLLDEKTAFLQSFEEVSDSVIDDLQDIRYSVRPVLDEESLERLDHMLKNVVKIRLQ